MQASLRCNASVATSSAPKAARRLAVVVRAEGSKINSKGIRAQEEKVVDTLKASDLGKKAVLCRCWKSNKFPYCDGQHVAHNKETGDNVGPLIIEGTTPASS